MPSFFHQRINAGSARLIVITSSAQCSPTETVESDISIWANGDFSIWRLQCRFADPLLWNIHHRRLAGSTASKGVRLPPSPPKAC